MKLWIDAQISPAVAAWINRTFDHIEAESVRALGLRDATDSEIFEEAKKADVIFMSKDGDFIQLIEQRGSPPKFIWVTCGNTSNTRMREILSTALLKAIELLNSGENVVELSDKEKGSR
jgi:predicted nuclease of predicted toxin-antitoxin system